MHQIEPRKSADSDQAEPAAARLLIVAPQPFFSERGTPIAISRVIRAHRELDYESRRADLPNRPRSRAARRANLSNPQSVQTATRRHRVLDAKVDPGRHPRRIDVSAAQAWALSVCSRGRRSGFSRRGLLPTARIAFGLRHAVQLAGADAQHGVFPSVADSGRPALCRTLALTRADVIACSLGLQSHVNSVHPKARVQEWWFPGQQFPVYAHQVSRIREEFGLTNGTQVVLYCGTFEPYQGLDELIKAAPRVLERVPDTIFLLVGDSKDHPFVLSLERRRLKEAGNIQIVPRQPSETIPSFYDVSDVVVSPRANGSNIPLKIFDYMAAGRPIVATDIPPHREVLNAERAELVAPTADAMATAISGLLADRDKARRLGEAAQSFSDQHLGWARFSESVNTIYDMALEGAEIDDRN